MASMGFEDDILPRRETLSRKKDLTRSKTAANRKRVKGLFVNKKKEQQLEKQENGNISDESETVEPDWA